MLSIFTWFGYDLSPGELFPAIRQAGFQAVALWWNDTFARNDNHLKPDAARREGLWIENIHAPFWNANHIWEDTEKGKATYDNYLQCVEECTGFEIPAMVVHASRGGGELPEFNALGLERFQRIVDLAERKGVNVAVENLRGEKATALAAALLEKIDSPRFGICYDSGHHHSRLPRESELDFLARFGSRLMALHLQDNDGTFDMHNLPFDGTIDWPAQMRAIAATGYQGPTTLEILTDDCDEMPVEEYLALAHERVKRLDELRAMSE